MEQAIFDPIKLKPIIMETFLVLLYAFLSVNTAAPAEVGEGMEEGEFAKQSQVDTGNDIRREIQEAV
ncbi:hypothetical protein ABN763_16390 [Spongiivirga sp. MCCC 1A20706]|uniref:hypothetical protein n=1 Tax=Spongiivirga sp. MCCC 1A20706 TaxID=3160963 RepID=UPI0039772934